MNVWCVLRETFRNFISVVTRHHCRDYVGKVRNKSEDICRNYKIFDRNVYFAEITKILKPSIYSSFINIIMAMVSHVVRVKFQNILYNIYKFCMVQVSKYFHKPQPYIKKDKFYRVSQSFIADRMFLVWKKYLLEERSNPWESETFSFEKFPWLLSIYRNSSRRTTIYR